MAVANSFILPGEAVPLPSSSKPLVFGPGIGPSSSRIASSSSPSIVPIATKPGLLSSKGKEKENLWIESGSRRYVPAAKDLVLGTIIARHAEGYRVDIGCAQMATLDALAFEGATKRSKPNLKVGTLVYARVTQATKDMEPELECFDPNTGRAEGFGELKGGYMVHCSLPMSRHLLDTNYPLLSAIGANFPFEVAVGINGRIWIKAGSVAQTIAMSRLLESVDRGEVTVDKAQLDKAIKDLLA